LGKIDATLLPCEAGANLRAVPPIRESMAIPVPCGRFSLSETPPRP